MHVSRPNVYKIIQGLQSHGLVKLSDKVKYSRTFMVEPPTVILEKLRQKKDNLSLIDNDFVSELPNLLATYHQGETSTKIKIMRGKEQYLKIFEQSLEETKNEIQYFGSADDFINFISWESELAWMKKRIKKDVLIKILVLSTETSKKLKARDSIERRETRFLHNVEPFYSSFQLFANKVIIFQPKAPLAVLIEDEYIVSMLKSIFDKLWKESEFK